MSICSLAFFNGNPCVVEVTGWHPHRHHAGPRRALRHDERRVETSRWPPPGTHTWPQWGLFHGHGQCGSPTAALTALSVVSNTRKQCQFLVQEVQWLLIGSDS